MALSCRLSFYSHLGRALRPRPLAMFRHFSFESSTSLHPSSSYIEHQRAAMNVSPTSIPFACAPPMQTRLSTPPLCSLGDLAQRFNRHNLRVEVPQPSQPASFIEPLTPPTSESGDSTFSDSSLSSSPSSYSTVSFAHLRSKRQAHTQLQCSPSHIRDISLLVERMIDQREQCLIRRGSEARITPCSSPIETDDDEGVSMDYTPPGPQENPRLALKYRRSGDRLNGHACVTKSVRMRKKPTKIRKINKATK